MLCEYVRVQMCMHRVGLTGAVCPQKGASTSVLCALIAQGLFKLWLEKALMGASMDCKSYCINKRHWKEAYA